MASMCRFLSCLSLLVAAGCFDDTTPSAFVPADAGPGGNHPQDGGQGAYDGSLLGDGGGPVTFPCGPSICPAQTYCVIALTDAGAETSEACYPLLSCAAGDCSCIQNVVQTSYCPGGHVTCKGTAIAGVVTTCAP
jgi:hypothetical protein